MTPTDFRSNNVRLVFLPNSSGNELECLKNFEKSSLSPLLNYVLQLLTHSILNGLTDTRALTGLLACLEVKDIGRKSNVPAQPLVL